MAGRRRFPHTPANGPAAILFARLGYLEQAAALTDWIAQRLHDEHTGLVLDGLHPGRPVERDFFTYNQGVVLGAETELANRVTAGSELRVRRAADLVSAIDGELAIDGVLRGHGGGNGGLFTGILSRYLALVVRELPVTTAAARAAVATATTLLRCSATAAWRNSARQDGLPVFGADWAVPATAPTSNRPGRRTPDGAQQSEQPGRDLSVQLGAWMLLEAVATLRE